MQGKISAADIQRISKDLGERFTDRDIQEMVEEADRDREFSSNIILLCLCMASAHSYNLVLWFQVTAK